MINKWSHDDVKRLSLSLGAWWPGGRNSSWVSQFLPSGNGSAYQMAAVLISLMKATTKNNRQQTFFLWLRWDIDELKLISDDKNYDEMYAASSLTRRDGTKMLFEDYRTFKIHPIGSVRPIPWTLGEPTILFYFFITGGGRGVHALARASKEDFIWYITMIHSSYKCMHYLLNASTI